MNLEIFDTAISNPHGVGVNVYFELVHKLKELRKQKARIKAVKPIFTYPGNQAAIFAIYYEHPAIIRQRSFGYGDLESEINDFMEDHDVIKVEHFSGEDYGEVITIVTYKDYK